MPECRPVTGLHLCLEACLHVLLQPGENFFMLCLSGLMMDDIIGELVSSVSELSSAANQLRKVVVQGL